MRHKNNKKRMFFILLIFGIFYLLYCVYEFGNVIHMFIFNCILSFVFGLPEVDSEWLDLVVEKSHCFIEKLNCLLCFFDTLIKYIADLIFWNFDSKLIDFVVFEFD